MAPQPLHLPTLILSGSGEDKRSGSCTRGAAEVKERGVDETVKRRSGHCCRGAESLLLRCGATLVAKLLPLLVRWISTFNMFAFCNLFPAVFDFTCPIEMFPDFDFGFKVDAMTFFINSLKNTSFTY